MQCLQSDSCALDARRTTQEGCTVSTPKLPKCILAVKCNRICKGLCLHVTGQRALGLIWEALGSQPLYFQKHLLTTLSKSHSVPCTCLWVLLPLEISLARHVVLLSKEVPMPRAWWFVESIIFCRRVVLFVISQDSCLLSLSFIK